MPNIFIQSEHLQLAEPLMTKYYDFHSTMFIDEIKHCVESSGIDYQKRIDGMLTVDFDELFREHKDLYFLASIPQATMIHEQFKDYFIVLDEDSEEEEIITNESACDEEFNHINYIQEAWQKAGFETDLQTHAETLNKNIKRKTKKSVKEILEDIEAVGSTSSFIFGNQEQLTKLKSKYPVLFDAYRKLTKEEIKSTNYIVKDIEILLILKNNKDAEMRVLKLLPLYFVVGRRYTKAEIKANLQEIYNKVGYTEKAKAEHLHSKKWYEIKECKILNKSRQYNNGFEIIRPQFSTIIGNK